VLVICNLFKVNFKVVPLYFYTAKNLKGESRSGAMEVKDKHTLARTLRKEGYILISARSEKDRSGKKALDIYIPFLSRVSLVDKIIFARNMRVMIGAGVSLPRSLEILTNQTENRKFKKIIADLKEKIIQGKSFSQALADYPGIFSELFVSMIKVGEESGTLENVLGVLSDQMDKNHQIISKIRGAMIYPLVILLAMLGIGVVMMIVVVPKLSKVFSDLKIELPLTTRFVIASSNFLLEFWYLILAFVLVFLFLLNLFLKTETGKKARDSLFLKLPILSSIIKKANSARTARTLSSLIEAGVPIARSLAITSKTLGNVYYQKALLEASQDIKKGKKLAEILGRHRDIYPNLVIQMIKVGEETGETAAILKKLAGFFEEEVAVVVKNLSSIIEPVLMLIIGAAVGFFAISVIQPIYGIVQGF
jgi:type IV pilus assembly protein PilC